MVFQDSAGKISSALAEDGGGWFLERLDAHRGYFVFSVLLNWYFKKQTKALESKLRRMPSALKTDPVP